MAFTPSGPVEALIIVPGQSKMIKRGTVSATYVNGDVGPTLFRLVEPVGARQGS